MVSPDYIYQGLIRRGMPPMYALAFMDNFAAESGFDPGINERNPVVPGSRGGRGLYQLTADRRDAFESKYGTDYNTDDQLDWLMYELTGPEKPAADKIFATDNRADATKAVSQHFLRPLHDNSASRVGMFKQGQPRPDIPGTGVVPREPSPSIDPAITGPVQRNPFDMGIPSEAFAFATEDEKKEGFVSRLGKAISAMERGGAGSPSLRAPSAGPGNQLLKYMQSPTFTDLFMKKRLG